MVVSERGRDRSAARRRDDPFETRERREEESARFAKAVVDRVALYDRIILLPHGILPLKADGVRSTNPWIQRRFHSTVRGLLEEEVGAPRFVQMPPLEDLVERLNWVRDLLTRSGEYASRPTK